MEVSRQSSVRKSEQVVEKKNLAEKSVAHRGEQGNAPYKQKIQVTGKKVLL